MAFIRTLLELPGEYGKPNPSGILPSLELQVNSDCPERLDSQRAAILPCDARVAALQILLEEKSLVVDLPKDWLLWAEALLLAVPGPMRRQISFAAGLRFSLGRGHTLHVLRDEKNAVQGKVAAQGIPFVEATSTPEQRQSAWISFAGRHWSSGDLAGLSRRTSRPFDDCSMPARERIAELYNSIDSIPQSEAGVVLNVAIRSFDASQPGEEEKVCIELREAAVSNLQNRLASQNWIQLQPLWDRLVALWQKGGKQAAFVQPLVNIALSAAVKSDPLLAAELAIAVARPSSGVDLGGHQTMLQHVLTQLCGSNLAPSSAERMANLIGRWRAARPTCSLISQLTHLLAQTGFQQGA